MDWIRGNTIGRGSSATVSIATASQSGDVFAVKSTEFSQSQFLKREQGILAGLSSPYVIAYKGCCITSENGKVLYNLLLEYAAGGSLSDAVREHGCLGEGMIRNYLRKILLGLVYLHSNGIVHCDIKGQNILVTSDGVKIADLGCARLVHEVSGDDWSTGTNLAGTPAYMAPEVARGEQQGFPADIWALGCTVIEMATGRAPWVGVLDPVSALYRIGFSGDVPEIPSSLSEQAKDFLSKCLKRDPKERWSAGELLNHGFLEETKSGLEEMSTFNMVTPTSVLDQGLMESEDELDTTWNPTQKGSSNSPMERIQKLSELSSKIPNWSLDTNWVTVRGNGSKEAEFCTNSQDYEDNLVASTGMAWIGTEDNLVLVVPNEPKMANVVDVFSCKCISQAIICDSESRHKIKSVMVFHSVKDVLCRNVHFGKRILCFLHFCAILLQVFSQFFLFLTKPKIFLVILTPDLGWSNLLLQTTVSKQACKSYAAQLLF